MPLHALPIRCFVLPRPLAGWWAAFLCAVLAGGVCGQEPGQTPRPSDTAPPVVPEEELVRLNKDLDEFKSVEDPGPFIFRGRKITNPKLENTGDAEVRAYEYVLTFARRQPEERLKKYAARDVPVENLFRPIRQDYLRELLHFEGRLALVLAMQPTPGLNDVDPPFTRLYEAWVFPRGSNKLVCLVVPELPAGVKVGEDQDVWVAFDAYYFKLFHYESRRPKDKSADPDKKQWESAPLFLGKTFEVIPSPPPPPPVGSSWIMAGVVGGVVALMLAGFGLALWFRRGDKDIQASARRRIEGEAQFENNPEPTAPVNRLTDQF